MRPKSLTIQRLLPTWRVVERIPTPISVIIPSVRCALCSVLIVNLGEHGDPRSHAVPFWFQHVEVIVVNKSFFRRCKPRTEQEYPMFYGNTKTLLESIVRGLQTEPPQNEAEWQAQTELVQACLTEMVEMSEPTINPAKGATSRYVHRPVADKLNRAMPHVRSMLTAMRDRDRTTAVAHGETTLQRL